MNKAWLATAVALLALAVALPFVSFGGSPDTPCGPLVARNFVWRNDNSCGLGYTRTTAAICATVVLSGGAAVLARRRR